MAVPATQIQTPRPQALFRCASSQAQRNSLLIKVTMKTAALSRKSTTVTTSPISETRGPVVPPDRLTPLGLPHCSSRQSKLSHSSPSPRRTNHFEMIHSSRCYLPRMAAEVLLKNKQKSLLLRHSDHRLQPSLRIASRQQRRKARSALHSRPHALLHSWLRSAGVYRSPEAFEATRSG